MRTAEIFVFDKFAGNLVEDDYGTFTFQYDAAYLEDSLPVAVSCTMPLKSEPYVSNSLFPFFDGLIPEGSEDMALTLNGKKAKIGRNDFIEFGKTIGLNERQVSRAVSRIIDALAANIDGVLAESQLTHEFAARFNKLVKRNIAKMR